MDARLDRVEIGSDTYYVVQATSTTFKLSDTSGGTPLSSFPNGPLPGTPTRVIGDQSFERSNKGCVPAYVTQIPVPSVCAKKVQGQQQTLDVWLWDSHNGRNGYG
jgi:hypothetical protein